MIKKTIMKILFIILFILTTFLLVIYKENLHCTQYTSFFIAVFNMQAHSEEAFQNLPMVYGNLMSIPLRIYLAMGILSYLYFPVVSGFFISIGKGNKKTLFITSILIFLMFLINTFIPIEIVGERFKWMYNFSVLYYGIILYIILWTVLILLKIKDKKVMKEQA